MSQEKTPIELIADALQTTPGFFIVDVLVPEQCLFYCMDDGLPVHVTADRFKPE